MTENEIESFINGERGIDLQQTGYEDWVELVEQLAHNGFDLNEAANNWFKENGGIVTGTQGDFIKYIKHNNLEYPIITYKVYENRIVGYLKTGDSKCVKNAIKYSAENSPNIEFEVFI